VKPKHTIKKKRVVFAIIALAQMVIDVALNVIVSLPNKGGKYVGFRNTS
jgi:hypothetical protein